MSEPIKNNANEMRQGDTSTNANYQNSQQYYQPPYQSPSVNGADQQYQGQPVMPQRIEPQKPRSAYIAAILHLLFPMFGLGYYYRGIDEKGRNCWIMFIVGVLTSFIFGIGAIVLLVAEILNIIEAIKLFKGDITTDVYGRTLYPEF